MIPIFCLLILYYYYLNSKTISYSMYPPSSVNSNDAPQYQYHDPPLSAPNRVNLPNFQYPNSLNS